MVRGDYRVQLVDGRPTVSWKDEFVREAGAERAADILKLAPVPKKIEVVANAA